jgi:hypothetical protein
MPHSNRVYNAETKATSPSHLCPTNVGTESHAIRSIQHCNARARVDEHQGPDLDEVRAPRYRPASRNGNSMRRIAEKVVCGLSDVELALLSCRDEIR